MVFVSVQADDTARHSRKEDEQDEQRVIFPGVKIALDTWRNSWTVRRQSNIARSLDSQDHSVENNGQQYKGLCPPEREFRLHKKLT